MELDSNKKNTFFIRNKLKWKKNEFSIEIDFNKWKTNGKMKKKNFSVQRKTIEWKKKNEFLNRTQTSFFNGNKLEWTKNVFQWKQNSMNEKRITYGNLFHNALNFYAFLATMRSKGKYRQNPGQMYNVDESFCLSFEIHKSCARTCVLYLTYAPKKLLVVLF